MDLIIGLLVLYWVFKAVVKKAQPEKNHAQRHGDAFTDGERQPSKPAATPRPEHRKAPMARPVFAEGASMQYEPMQSHIQHRLTEQPDMSEYVGGMSVGKNDYTGSLGGGSTEGQDICDPSLGHDDGILVADENDVYAPAAESSNAQWSGKAILQGVVMSEILTRPSERKWGKL